MAQRTHTTVDPTCRMLFQFTVAPFERVKGIPANKHTGAGRNDVGSRYSRISGHVLLLTTELKFSH